MVHWSKGPDAEDIRRRLGEHNSDRAVSAETRAKMVRSHTGVRHSEEAKRRMRKPKNPDAVDAMRKTHWTKNPDQRGLAIAKIKKSRTMELRLKVSEDVRNGVCGFRVSKWNTYQDRKGRPFHFRSSWELLVAVWLDEKCYDWEYEPKPIVLTNGSVYLPDFELADGRLLEVKGYLSSTAWEKIVLVRGMGRRLLLLDKKFLKRMGLLCPPRRSRSQLRSS